MGAPPNWQLTARVILVAAFVLLAVWMLERFLPALAWAAVLAIATWPARERLVRSGAEPWLAATLLTLLLTLALIVPLIVIGIQIAREALVLVQWVRALRDSGLPTPDWVPQLPWVGAYAATWWQDHLADAEGAKELLGRAESVGVVHWTRLGSQLAGRLAILVFTLLTLFFLYRDGPLLIEQSRTIGDRLFGPAVKHICRGALATVPFGAPLVFTVAALMLAADSQVASGVVIFALGCVVVFVADHFVRPALIGSSTRLPFLWVLLGIFGGLETFGLVGLFLGPAIISVVLAVWRDVVSMSAPGDGISIRRPREGGDP
jgi:predicted PurR-regulated permease PerM